MKKVGPPFSTLSHSARSLNRGMIRQPAFFTEYILRDITHHFGEVLDWLNGYGLRYSLVAQELDVSDDPVLEAVSAIFLVLEDRDAILFKLNFADATLEDYDGDWAKLPAL